MTGGEKEKDQPRPISQGTHISNKKLHRHKNTQNA